MFRFFLTRASLLVPTFIGMTLLAFFLIRLVPGDPIETLAGERGIDPVRHAALLKDYGLDKPLFTQYGIYIGRVLHGDLGKSVITQEPVMSEFLALFPATVELALCAIAFALLLGIPAGILAAVKRNSLFDHGVMATSLTGYSMPIFWWGLLLILFFSVQLGWTPVSGRIAVQYYVEPVTGFLLIDSLLSDDTDRRKALGARRADVILAQDLQHRRARHAGDDGQWNGAEHDGRQDEVRQRRLEGAPVAGQQGIDQQEPRLRLDIELHGDPAGYRRPSELHREQQDQQQAPPEDRHRVAGE